MKLKVAVIAVLWTLLISSLHVHLNMGWGGLLHRVKVALGMERSLLMVGYLPVT